MFVYGQYQRKWIVSALVLGGMLVLGAGCGNARSLDDDLDKNASGPTDAVGETSSTQAAPDTGRDVNRTTDTVDETNWKTYREPALGFEIRYPADWDGGTQFLGEGPIDDLGRWKNRIGKASWSTDNVDLEIDVRKAKLTIEEMNLALRMDYSRRDGSAEIIKVNGLSAMRSGNPLEFHESYEPSSRWQMQDRMLIQDGDMFYSIDFSISTSSGDTASRSAREWDAVLKSFKTFPITQ